MVFDGYKKVTRMKECYLCGSTTSEVGWLTLYRAESFASSNATRIDGTPIWGPLTTHYESVFIYPNCVNYGNTMRHVRNGGANSTIK